MESHIEHEFDDLTPLCVIPIDDPPIDVPTSTQPNPNTPHPEPDIGIQQPQPQPQPQPETVDASLPDPFDIEEEYVGVDDEHMYMPTPPTQPTAPTQSADNEQDDGVDNANAEVEVNDEIQRSFMCFTILNIQTLRRRLYFLTSHHSGKQSGIMPL